MGVGIRGAEGAAAPPTFGTGEQAIALAPPKSLSLLHCDVRLSRINLDILEFYLSVGRSRTKKLSASGGLCPPDPSPRALPLDPAGGSAPRPHYRLTLHALAMAPDTACSPNFQILPTPM